jgi:RimJ/RimL family protein N-acetyltransferase
MNDIVLADGDLALRRFRRDDRETLAKLANNANVSKYLTDQFPYPYTLEAADSWISNTVVELEPHNFAVEWQGRLVGGIGLVPQNDVHRQTANIGYGLGEPYWGNGLASRAVGLMAGHLFSAPKFIRLQAFIDAENKASARVLEKSGFVREGLLRRHITKNGCIHDALLYARLRD